MSPHYTTQALRMYSPFARLVRIMSPTILPRRCVCIHLLLALCPSFSPTILPGPRRTLGSHDCKHTSCKLSGHVVTLCSPCAHHVPHYTTQALRMYSPFARLVHIIFPTILPRHSHNSHNTQHTRVKQNTLCFSQKDTQPSQTCSRGHITPNPTKNRCG
jgi:hypothetical protein